MHAARAVPDRGRHHRRRSRVRRRSESHVPRVRCEEREDAVADAAGHVGAGLPHHVLDRRPAVHRGHHGSRRRQPATRPQLSSRRKSGCRPPATRCTCSRCPRRGRLNSQLPTSHPDSARPGSGRGPGRSKRMRRLQYVIGLTALAIAAASRRLRAGPAGARRGSRRGAGGGAPAGPPPPVPAILQNYAAGHRGAAEESGREQLADAPPHL